MTENKNNVYIFADIDTSNHVERKGWAKYLNWAFVNDELHKHDDNASYSVKQYPVFDLKTRQVIPHMYQHYFLDPNTNDASVTVTVTFRGKSQTETLPCYQQIKNHGMESVKNPDSMLINKTAKRAEVKAAAELTGLGISLYMDGSTKGADKVSNESHRYSNNSYRYNSRRNNSRTYPRRASNRYGQSQVNGNSSNRTPAKPQMITNVQINQIHGLMNDIDMGQINDNGVLKAYKWAYNNNFKGVTAFTAKCAINYLRKAPKKSVKKSKTNIPSKKSVKNPKQTTLMK